MSVVRYHSPYKLTKAYPDDACFDLQAWEDIMIPPNSWQVVSTGLKIAIPEGYMGLILERSGLAMKHGLMVIGGVIDPGYRGEVKVMLYNPSDTAVIVMEGDRIAQLAIVKVWNGKVSRVESEEELGASKRGTNGFGSSGK